MCPDERFYYHIAEADATEPLTKEEIWEYSEGLQNKCVYIIDRNPEFGEANNETVRLIQVILTSNNRPQRSVIIVNE